MDNIGYDKLTNHQALLPIMSKMLKELRAAMTREFAESGIKLTKEQAIVLRILKNKNGLAQHDLALVTSRDKTSLTRLLSTMQKKDLIYRQPDEKDKRVNRVFISDNGKAELKYAEPIMLELLNRATTSLTQKEIDQTKAVIRTIHQNILTTNE